MRSWVTWRIAVTRGTAGGRRQRDDGRRDQAAERHEGCRAGQPPPGVGAAVTAAGPRSRRALEGPEAGLADTTLAAEVESRRSRLRSLRISAADW